MLPAEIPKQIQNPLHLDAQERAKAHAEIILNSLPTGTFFGMNLLASVIAGYGLLQDSPAVVIGAMLVAMMLGPIAGLGLAVLSQDRQLLLAATSSVALGTFWVIGVGFVIGLIHSQHVLTPEIIGRTAPNIMDLMIALAGGFAGAIALVSSRLPVAVVGVGVATALVPPLVTCGILLSRGQFHLAAGAFLLTATNMVAIQFSTSLVLWLTGFRCPEGDSPVHFIRANLWSLILLSVLGVTLTLNLTKAATRQRLDVEVSETLREHLETGSNRLISTKILLTGALRSSDSEITVMAYLQGEKAPTRAQVQQAQEALPRLRNLPPLHLQLRFVPVEIINATLSGPDTAPAAKNAPVAQDAVSPAAKETVSPIK